jgi:hypothetical protein
MVWVNPPNRVAVYFITRIPQSSTPGMHKMFNRDVDLVLHKKNLENGSAGKVAAPDSRLYTLFFARSLSSIG